VNLETDKINECRRCEGKVPFILALGLYAHLKNKFVGFVEKGKAQ